MHRIYRVSQEETPVCWELTGLVILRKKVYTYMCLIMKCSEMELFQVVAHMKEYQDALR
jgi:hypothetical protein